LNNVAEVLRVPKRRVYDITCVLEGIGLLTKVQKNVVKWSPPPEMIRRQPPREREVVCEPAVHRKEIDDTQVSLEGEIKSLAEAERQLDQAIRSETTALHDLLKNPAAFLHVRDVFTLHNENVVLAIHPPPGTELRVPDPYLSAIPTFQLEMNNAFGPVHVRVLRNVSQPPLFIPVPQS